MNDRELSAEPGMATRRSFLVAAAAAPWLSACGGGSGSDAPSPPPQRGSYTVIPTAFAVSQHTATRAADGRVVVIGGSRGESTLSAGIDRFDLETSAFQRIGALASGRGSHAATPLLSGAILVSGGMSSSGDRRVAELVDPATGAVVAAGAMSVPRMDHAAVRLPDGRVFITGGYASGERAALGISDSAEIWDPATMTFTRLASHLLVPRAGHTATLLASGKVLVAGGYTSVASYTFAEIFDPADQSFTAVAASAPVRAKHTAHLAPDGRVLLVGGETVAADGITPVPLASVLSYGAGGVQAEADLAAPRTWSEAVTLASGDVILFGGQRQLPDYTDTVERYSRPGGATAQRPMDTDRALHTATLLADGRVLVLGGEGQGGVYRTTALLYQP